MVKIKLQTLTYNSFSVFQFELSRNVEASEVKMNFFNVFELNNVEITAANWIKNWDFDRQEISNKLFDFKHSIQKQIMSIVIVMLCWESSNWIQTFI